MKSLVIVGAGALGQQIANCAVRNGWNVKGYYDDYQQVGAEMGGGKIIGDIGDLIASSDLDSEIVIAVGYKHFKKRESIFESLVKKFKMATIIDSTAIIDKTANIGCGSVIMPGAIIDKGVKVGRNCFINISTTIAHDSCIGDHSFLAPSVAIAGFTQIGKRTFVGINSTIIDNLTIVDDSFVGGGSVVINSLNVSGVYVGNPVRKIK